MLAQPIAARVYSGHTDHNFTLRGYYANLYSVVNLTQISQQITWRWNGTNLFFVVKLTRTMLVAIKTFCGLLDPKTFNTQFCGQFGPKTKYLIHMQINTNSTKYVSYN